MAMADAMLVVSLIPKPTGGERLIYLQCMINRVLAKVRKQHIQGRSVEEADFWDIAVY